MKIPRSRTCARRRRFIQAHGECFWCHSTQNLTLDHIYAKGLGGSNAIRNWQVLCAMCNRVKGDIEHEIMLERDPLRDVRHNTRTSSFVGLPMPELIRLQNKFYCQTITGHYRARKSLIAISEVIMQRSKGNAT